jgi:hypothetical protein
MVGRVTTACKCRQKCKNPENSILVEDPEEALPPPLWVPLYPPPTAPLLSPLEGEATSGGEALAANMPRRLGPEVLETATTPPSSGPMNLMLTLSPPVLTLQLPVSLALRFNQEHFFFFIFLSTFFLITDRTVTCHTQVLLKMYSYKCISWDSLKMQFS